jgi:hypothetical protein
MQVPLVDLCVRGDADAADLPQVRQRALHGGEGAHAPAQPIVHVLEAIDRDRNTLQAGVPRGEQAVAREPERARGHLHQDAALAAAPDDLEPVVAQIGLAADQRDLFHGHRGHLVDEVQRLGGVQLVRAGLAGAGAAVQAPKVTAERDLPDGVDRPVVPVDGPHRVVQDARSFAGGRVGQDGQAQPAAVGPGHLSHIGGAP